MVRGMMGLPSEPPGWAMKLGSDERPAPAAQRGAREGGLQAHRGRRRSGHTLPEFDRHILPSSGRASLPALARASPAGTGRPGIRRPRHGCEGAAASAASESSVAQL